jgi:hypothetical protein
VDFDLTEDQQTIRTAAREPAARDDNDPGERVHGLPRSS